MNIEMESLKEENLELKKALAVLMNKALVQELTEALKRINSGEYISEKEFFKSSLQ